MAAFKYHETLPRNQQRNQQTTGNKIARSFLSRAGDSIRAVVSESYYSGLVPST
jgi:hypothetical protein